MPIPDFQGDTFVAFVDISGFKEMMKNQTKAVLAIDCFYSSGYSILQENRDVHGMFVSECAVLFVHNDRSNNDKLANLLTVIEHLNRELIAKEIMLTTSIAYGPFSYHQRLEFPGIEKNPIYGNAYVAAFLDNESKPPTIRPGECRIIKRGLPDIDLPHRGRMEESEKHWHFYWMVNDTSQIERFKYLFNDAYQKKYRGMLEAIKKASNNEMPRTCDSLRSSPAADF